MAFILALELLATKIRADPSVKGISVPRNHKCFLKLLIYADDITLFLQDRDDLKNALSLVSHFSKFSWLAMNRSKTEAMCLRSKQYCTDDYYDIKWKLRVKILGVYFSNSIPGSEIDDNWLPRIENIHSQLVKKKL